jgi:hypothetical protein
MMHGIRNFDLWRGYACVMITAALLAGCSSDVTGPGSGGTGAPRVDLYDGNDRLDGGRPVLPRCGSAPLAETQFVCKHDTVNR